MLKTSRLYSFTDQQSRFNIVFFEGQKLISELAVTNQLSSQSFRYFRNTVLTFQPLIYFLKGQEGLGIYIDSETPYFRFKIETNAMGRTRTLILPEDIQTFPSKITGKCRIIKLFPKQSQPYTSIIDLHDVVEKNIVQLVLEQSYQVQAKLILSEKTDTSLLVHKLPKSNVNQNLLQDDTDLKSFMQSNKLFFDEVLTSTKLEEKNILELFQNNKYHYLQSKEVKFHCPCSHRQMLHNVAKIAISQDELFQGEETLEIRCDYCKKYYHIQREQLDSLKKQ